MTLPHATDRNGGSLNLSPTTTEVKNCGYNKENEADPKKDLRYTRSTTGDTTESKKGRDKCDDEESDCPA